VKHKGKGNTLVVNIVAPKRKRLLTKLAVATGVLMLMLMLMTDYLAGQLVHCGVYAVTKGIKVCCCLKSRS